MLIPVQTKSLTGLSTNFFFLSKQLLRVTRVDPTKLSLAKVLKITE